MKRIIVIVVIIAAPFVIHGQLVRYPMMIPYLSSGQYSASGSNPFSRVANPATLPGIQGFSAGLYVEKRFLVQGLSLGKLSAVLGSKTSGAGLQISYFGNFRYHETSAILSYGRSLGKLQLGITFNYQSFRLAGFAHKSLAGFGFATLWKLSDKVCSSLQFLDLLSVKRENSHGEQLAALCSLGFGWEASSQVYAGMELIRKVGLPLQVGGIVVYAFSEKFYAKTGFYTGGGLSFFGVGWKWKGISTEISLGYHSSLGLSPAILLIYEYPRTDQSEELLQGLSPVSYNFSKTAVGQSE